MCKCKMTVDSRRGVAGVPPSLVARWQRTASESSYQRCDTFHHAVSEPSIQFPVTPPFAVCVGKSRGVQLSLRNSGRKVHHFAEYVWKKNWQRYARFADYRMRIGRPLPLTTTTAPDNSEGFSVGHETWGWECFRTRLDYWKTQLLIYESGKEN